MPSGASPMYTIDITTRLLDHSHANGFGVRVNDTLASISQDRCQTNDSSWQSCKSQKSIIAMAPILICPLPVALDSISISAYQHQYISISLSAYQHIISISSAYHQHIISISSAYQHVSTSNSAGNSTSNSASTSTGLRHNQLRSGIDAHRKDRKRLIHKWSN